MPPLTEVAIVVLLQISVVSEWNHEGSYQALINALVIRLISPAVPRPYCHISN